MNTTLALLIVLVAAVCAETVVDASLIKDVNSSSLGWVAGETKMSSLTVEEARMYLGALPARNTGVPVVSRHVRPMADLPTEFNSFAAFPSLSPLVKNQEKCGSCWAFSATSVLGYRFNIEGASNSTLSTLSLAPQDPVSCDAMDAGCGGGNLPSVWSYMQSSGVVEAACMPYTSGSGDNGTCNYSCTAPGVSYNKYHAKNFAHIPHSLFGVKAIQTELVKNGPVQAAFTVYSDFMAYKGGVYSHHSGKELGGHAVTIVGYGHEDGHEYWLIQNSWGTDWGVGSDGNGSTGGYFKINVNSCGISSSVYAGQAQI